MKLEFDPDTEFGKELKMWWDSLEHNRGDRAILRRCEDVLQVVMTPVFHHQLREWHECFSRNNGDRLAEIMGLLSHVRQHSQHSIGAQMATPRGDTPTVSELRFRRLLQSTREEYYRDMIGMIKLLRGEINIHDLAESTYYWGDKTKKRWAYDYYEKIPNRSKK